MEIFGVLNRPLDVRYPTNRLILILAAIAGGFAGLQALLGGGEFWLAGNYGFMSGAAVFFGWAICREIDPNNERAAFLAAVFGWALHFWVGPLNFLGMLLLVMMLRLHNRVTGYLPTWVAMAVPAVISIWLGYSGHWEFTVLAGFGLLLESRLYGSLEKVGLAGLALSLAGLVGLGTSGAPLYEDLRLPGILITLALIILWRVFVGRYRIATKDDRGGQWLDAGRLRAAQWFVLSAVIFLFVLGGTNGLVKVGGGLAAVLGALLFPLIEAAAGNLVGLSRRAG